MTSTHVPPITEEDIANFLTNTPGFFERHAEVLASVQITSPHGQRAVSLQERQAEMLREKIKVLELRFMELMRHGNDNMLLHEKMQNWVLQLLFATDPAHLPSALVHGLCSEFDVPQAALRLWDLAEGHAEAPFAAPVSEDVHQLAAYRHLQVTPPQSAGADLF